VVLVDVVLVVGVDALGVVPLEPVVLPAGETVTVLVVVLLPHPVSANAVASAAVAAAMVAVILMKRCSGASGSDPSRRRSVTCQYPWPMQHPPGTHQPRPRRKVDWELISCGFRGHAIVGTDAAELRPQDALIAREQGDHRWYRCLRCDSWVALAPPEEPTRQHPPDRDEIAIPRRGKALRDRVVLRLIAIDRAFHFVIFVLLGIAVIAFASNESSLRDAYYRILTDLQRGVAGGPVQNTGHVGILHEFDRLFTLRAGALREFGIAVIALGILEGIEAVGLWYTKRWAEYLTFIATALLLPLEIYELTHRLSALKIIGFLINVAVVVYLLFAKRLFGLRGGGRADEELRAHDMSWEAIEHATPPVTALVPSGGASSA
jgi:uncharacterized membrane protein (DUF2068 family)